MKTQYIECESNQSEMIKSPLPYINLPSGFELFSLTILSQVISRPDQSVFAHSCIDYSLYHNLLEKGVQSFDMTETFLKLSDRYLGYQQNTPFYQFSDFSENAANNIFNPDDQKSNPIKKALFEQIFNRQALKFYAVNKKEKIINIIQKPLAQNTIFYAKSDYIDSEIPRAICLKQKKSNGFFPALEHVWTIFRENNKYSLFIRFFNSIYIPYRPSEKALPVAVCYYPNTFIKLIAQNFKSLKKKSNVQNYVSFPTQINSNSIDRLLNVLDNYLHSSELTNLEKQKTPESFIKLTKLAALNSAVFAKSFLKLKIEQSKYYSIISMYPKIEWKKIKFILSNIKDYQYKNVKDQYSKFILWMIHANMILRKKDKADFKNILGLITTTIPGNNEMVLFAYNLYKYYYYNLDQSKIDKELFIKVCSFGNLVFNGKEFCYKENGKREYPDQKEIIFDYGFDCLRNLEYTIPEIINEFDVLGSSFIKLKIFSFDKKINFCPDIEYIKTIIIPDVFSIICTEFKKDTK